MCKQAAWMVPVESIAPKIGSAPQTLLDRVNQSKVYADSRREASGLHITARADGCATMRMAAPANRGALRNVQDTSPGFSQSWLMPPSAMISVPTMNADSGAERCSTVAAISSAVPKRPSGIWLWICAAVACNSAASSPSLP